MTDAFEDFKKTHIAIRCCVGCLTTAQKKPLKQCSGCHLIKYCSTECQRKNWPNHKKTCARIKKMGAEAWFKENFYETEQKMALMHALKGTPKESQSSMQELVQMLGEMYDEGED